MAAEQAPTFEKGKLYNLPVIDFAESVSVTDDTLSVNLSDGRTILVPTAWYPRLLCANPDERNKWRLIGRGHGIHWEDIDEDISIEGLLVGKQSGESQASFKKWFEARQARKTTPERVRPTVETIASDAAVSIWSIKWK